VDRKVAGKTVTVRLTHEQADLLAAGLPPPPMDKSSLTWNAILRATDRLLKELPPRGATRLL